MNDFQEPTLSAFGDAVLAQERSAQPQVCILEQLGGLLIRSVGGFSLVSETLALMSRTDSRWLWIATTSEAGWRMLETADPTAAALVLQRTLSPLDRSDVERIILQRHQRSGVPLEFQPPRDPNPLLARRLRRANKPEERQRILREAYFDRLFSIAGQDIMMALFYWIRSVQMTDDGSTLHVQWFTPIRFDFMTAFSIDQAFALKAILERGTLTVAQHAETNLMSMQESRRIMESLGNALLIEPVLPDSSPTRFDFTAVSEGLPYRIRPLLVHPVLSFLRQRNIVH